MATKSILLGIADPQILIDVAQALGAGWEVTSVANEADALAQLEKRSVDAFLVDFNLCSPDASELLNEVLEKRPEISRFLLAYEADLALVAAKVLGSVQILPKPIETASLKSRIEIGVENAESQQDPQRDEPAGDQSPTPATPSIYSDVLKVFEASEVTSKLVGEAIGRDETLASEVFRLANSTYLGLPRNITDPVEAVESIGLEAAKALILALQFLAEHSRLKPGYLSFDQIWQHSVNVAQIARDLVLFETKDRMLASQALAAGLLHDLGKVVLVTNFDDLYGRVYSLARKQPVTLWDVEKEMFGANHGEIGACLLGMWNMPSAIVDAAALHHEPPLGEQDQLTPLAAVHIANVLERELRPDNEDLLVAPIINTPFLNELGLLQRLPVWRAAFANRRSDGFPQEPQVDEMLQSRPTASLSTAATRTANHLPGPESETRTITSGQTTQTTQKADNSSRLVYAGVAIALLLLAALWFATQPAPNQGDAIYARTVVSHEAPAAVPATQLEEPSSASEPALTVSKEPSKPSAPTTPQTEPAAPQPQPTVSVPTVESTTAATPQPSVTNPPPTALPPQKAQPEFHVNAIIFSSFHPSAIVNGETVNVGEKINGATVLAIGRTSVVLQINGKRQTFELK